MDNKFVSWAEFQNIYSSGNFYFTEYLDGEESPDVNLYLQQNSMLGIVCRLQNGSADYDDYIANWQSLAGAKTYIRHGWCHDFGDSDTFDFYLNDASGAQVESYLYDGSLVFYGAFQIGDKYEITVEHPIAGTVGYLCKDCFVESLENKIELRPPKYDYTTSKKKIPAGIFLRVKHLSGTAAGAKILIHAEYEY